MISNNLLDRCLAILYHIKDNKESLKILLDFMEEKFVSEIQEEDVSKLTDYKLQIDEKYRLVIKEIAEYLVMGHTVFVNPETLEVDATPDYNSMMADLEFDYDRLEDWIKIMSLESHESYEIMKSFVESLPNGKEKNKFTEAIENHKPFAKFNSLIHHSEERKNWFKYQTYQVEKYVIDNHLAKILNYNIQCKNN